MDAKTTISKGDQYLNFAALATSEVANVDYRITLERRRTSRVAIIAPHGGSIERRTSAIARALASEDFNLYLFEGLDDKGSFDELHITSHRFDEPRCLALIGCCEIVLAVHGCSGDEHHVMLGGRDRETNLLLEAALRPCGVPVSIDDHPYPGSHETNICNRGKRGKGIQLELTDSLRGSPEEAHVVSKVREVLLRIAE